MANVPVPVARDDSKYRVAYQLLEAIALVEGVNLMVQSGATRAWILKTYAECIHAADGAAGRISTAQETASWLNRQG